MGGSPDGVVDDTLRSQVAEQARQIEALQAEVRGLRRPSPGDEPPSPGPDESVSRRRLLGLAGTAAAAGVGGALLAASPAAATSALQIDGSLATNSGSATTNLESSTTGLTFFVFSGGTGGTAIAAQCTGAGVGVSAGGASGTGVEGSATSGTGVVGQTSNGYAGRFEFIAPLSPLAQLLLKPDPQTSHVGAPSSGTHQAGELYVDTNAALFYCVGGGMPGIWVAQSPLVTITPVRIYDSRTGQLPSTPPKSPITNGATRDFDVTIAGGSPSGVPASARAVLGNITIVNASSAVYLTIYQTGLSPSPTTSNVNAAAGVTVANSFTSQVGVSVGTIKITVQCGGGPTDFIVDLFGYYP
jgi:hypothetical protein